MCNFKRRYKNSRWDYTGFLIVNVKKHVNSFSELDKETRVEVGNVIAYAEKALRELKIVLSVIEKIKQYCGFREYK